MSCEGRLGQLGLCHLEQRWLRDDPTGSQVAVGGSRGDGWSLHFSQRVGWEGETKWTQIDKQKCRVDIGSNFYSEGRSSSDTAWTKVLWSHYHWRL